MFVRRKTQELTEKCWRLAWVVHNAKQIMLISEDHPQALVALRSFSAGLAERNITILHQDTDLVYDLVENLPGAWPAQDVLGQTDAGHGEWAEPWVAAKLEVLRTARATAVEIHIPHSDGRRIYEACLKPDTDMAGVAQGIITVLSDVTEMRERELAVTSLMREVSHRSKNLLAIVQSIAAQTAHHSEGTADFLQKFRGRVQALASIQDLVTESNWRGILFQSLVRAQLDRLGESRPDCVRITGENPMLGPNAALHIGLALHELLSNARTYGALALNRPGDIWISSHIVPSPDSGSELVIEWLESKLAHRSPAPPARFGTMVLKKIVPLSVGGSAEHELGENGLSYRLRVPAGQFEN